jgi:hypothetical protein
MYGYALFGDHSGATQKPATAYRRIALDDLKIADLHHQTQPLSVAFLAKPLCFTFRDPE